MNEKSPTTDGLGAFNDLATEVVITIFSHVDWRDLLSIRKTCKYFHEVSKTKVLWENCVRLYTLPTPNSPGCLKTHLPLSVYTSAELEHAIKRWEISEYSWPQGLLYKSHTLIRLPSHIAVHLLKGGRYLLRLLHDGSVVYHDLDKKQRGFTVLIPPQQAPLNRTYIDFTVDEIDNDAPVTSSSLLLARIAISYYTGATVNTSRHTMDVWGLHLNAATRLCEFNLDLAAKRISTVQLPADLIFVASMVLFNDDIAFTCISRSTQQLYLCVINWFAGKRKVKFDYPIRYISEMDRPRCKTKIYLLENSLLLVIDLRRCHVALWSFDTCKESTQHPPIASSFAGTGAMVWKNASLSNHLRDFYEVNEVNGPFKCSNSTRFIISGSSRILGVIIYPRLPPGSTVIFDFLEIPQGIRFAAQSCYHRTVYQPRFPLCIGEATAVTLRWPDEDGESSLAQIPAEQIFYPAFLSNHTTGRAIEEFAVLMDDASGRIVTVSPSFGIMEIWETAPIS